MSEPPVTSPAPPAPAEGPAPFGLRIVLRGVPDPLELGGLEQVAAEALRDDLTGDRRQRRGTWYEFTVAGRQYKVRYTQVASVELFQEPVEVPGDGR